MVRFPHLIGQILRVRFHYRTGKVGHLLCGDKLKNFKNGVELLVVTHLLLIFFVLQIHSDKF